MTAISKAFIIKDDLIIDQADGRQFVIPVGEDLNRPSSPIQGTMRYNVTRGVCDIFNGTDWQSAASAGDAVNAQGAEEIALVQSIIFG